MTAPTTAATTAAPSPSNVTPRAAAPPGRLAPGAGVPFARLLRAIAVRSSRVATPSRGVPGREPSATATACPPPRQTGGHGHAGQEQRREKERDAPEADPLDPETRRLAQLAPPHARIEAEGVAGPTARPTDPGGEVAPRARVSLEELLPQLVRRIAWAGDRQRGSAQLELGSGRHAGAVVTVHAEDGRVRVDVRGSDELRARIGERLARRGIDVESVS